MSSKGKNFQIHQNYEAQKAEPPGAPIDLCLRYDQIFVSTIQLMWRFFPMLTVFLIESKKV